MSRTDDIKKISLISRRIVVKIWMPQKAKGENKNEKKISYWNVSHVTVTQ